MLIVERYLCSHATDRGRLVETLQRVVFECMNKRQLPPCTFWVTSVTAGLLPGERRCTRSCLSPLVPSSDCLDSALQNISGLIFRSSGEIGGAEGYVVLSFPTLGISSTTPLTTLLAGISSGSCIRFHERLTRGSLI